MRLRRRRDRDATPAATPDEPPALDHAHRVGIVGEEGIVAGSGPVAADQVAPDNPAAAEQSAPPASDPAAADKVAPPAQAGPVATDPAAAEQSAPPAQGAPVAPVERFPQPSVDPEAPEDAEADAALWRGGRPPALRLAGLHLRSGLHALARAELEALANRRRLDDAGQLDLAEVRWRTGDLAGAGDAAATLLERGLESPLALVIAAEAVASAGRPTEARRLSSRALELADGPLDPLFAGMPRGLIWPVEPAVEPSPAATRRRRRRPGADADGAPSTASEAFAGGRAALAKGDASRAALLLGVAMRLEPGFAEDVLRAVAGRDDQPLLALVRGDALRLLGREADALEAFDRARGRSAVGGPSAEPPRGPGLFDDDSA